jgi:ABC-type uncharacterized transport system permease subunit
MQVTLFHTFRLVSIRIFCIGLSVLVALSLLLLMLQMSPWHIAKALVSGSILSWTKFSYALSIWVPLVLCASGLLYTFRIGLWNIGIEGQIVCGAIAATMVLRFEPVSLSSSLLLSLGLLAGFVGGAMWGLTAGLLRRYGGVNEIFGGLGLNFVAQGLILWLILGPWKRSGIASMSGTDLFPRHLWLTNPKGWQVAPVSLAIAVAVYLLSVCILRYTRFGLQIKACGQNPEAARLYNINGQVVSLLTMAICGGIAGIAGGLQTTAVYHRLLPAISSGYGYLGLLVVMFAGYKPLPVPFIALLFSCLVAGSIQLPMMLQIDSSLSGVIQGGCVIIALLFNGLQRARRDTP